MRLQDVIDGSVQFNVGVSLKTKTTEDDLKGKQRRTKTAAQSWADLIKTVTYCVTTAHPTEACTCFHNVCLNVHVNDASASAQVTAETETQISDCVLETWTTANTDRLKDLAQSAVVC